MHFLTAVTAMVLSLHAAPVAARHGDVMVVPASWAPADSADALWRKARSAIAAGNFDDADDLFRQIHDRYPKSAYAGDSYYWEAYALSQIGDTESMRRAVKLLDTQAAKYAQAATYTSGEWKALSTRLKGRLARGGDAASAEAISAAANSAVAYGGSGQSYGGSGQSYGAGNARGQASSNSRSSSGSNSSCKREEDDDRVEALNALLQMNSDQALPILKKVMAKRDTCSELLRRKAVFLISQKRGDDASDMLVDAARNDPDQETREQAIFWLGQTSGTKSIGLLEDILKSAKDESTQSKVVWSLGQIKDDRAQQILRTAAMREDISSTLRDGVIFALSQHRSPENTKFLRDLFAKTSNEKTQDQVLFSLSQMRGQGNEDWLADQAVNAKLSIHIRNQALFWAGQSGLDATRIAALYDKGTDVEFKNQVLFVLSQSRSPAALDKLIAVTKEEKNNELRKQALFWLGQSRDPRALKAIQDIIDR